MYETILSLPFFSGIDEDAVSQFVEKVAVHFVNFSDGESLIRRGDECDGLIFTLAGNVRIRLHGPDNTLAISYAMPPRTVLGAEYLYGMERHFPYDATAIGNVSVMRISKSDFAWLMRQNEICGINYFNYLCRRSQRALEHLHLMGEGSLERIVTQLVSQYTEHRAEDICIECSPEQMSYITGLSLQQIEDSERKMAHQDIAYRTEQGLCIPSRRQILP